MMKKSKQPDLKQIHYDAYHFTCPEFILAVLEGLILVALIAHCFYDSYLAMLFLSPVIIVFVFYKREQLKIKRKEALRVQFKDMVMSISTNQKAGYSIENAFVEAYQDMKMLYGPNSDICKELDYMRRGLNNNIVLEDLLLSFGKRSGIEDIEEFAEVFMIAKRSGGNLTQIIQMTAMVIEEKIDVDQDIQVVISSKKMESNIMCCIPFGMILYMGASSPGFFDILYHNIGGILIMTVCLIIYGIAFILSRKITDITV